jgi:hypothetical protein
MIGKLNYARASNSLLGRFPGRRATQRQPQAEMGQPKVFAITFLESFAPKALFFPRLLIVTIGKVLIGGYTSKD